MKKIFAMVFAVLAVAATAQERKVGDEFGDGILNFKVLSLSPAEVEIARSPNATGVVNIPAEIEDYGVVYKVVRIGDEAFSLRKDENPYITGAVIPEGIREIGWQAFMGCRYVKSWHFPSTLEKIGNSAFYCYNDKPSKLQEVRCDAIVPPACGEMVFGSRFNAKDGNSRDIPLYVPVGTVQAYRAEKQWDVFNLIIDVEGQESSTVDEQHYNSDPDAEESGSGSEEESSQQGLSDIQVVEKAHKVIIDGQLRIVRGDKVFDATGKEL